MSTVNGMTAEAMIAIRDNVVVGGVVNGSGHLILTKYDSTTIDAGSVIGPTGSPGATSLELSDLLPVNSIIEYNGATPPNAKWLAMAGQTVTNAQTLYPAWWAVIPTAMKSGANAIMPDTRGKVSVGYNTGDTDFDTIGEIGGSKTHMLTQAELPAASVTVNPPPTTVTIDPPNTAVTGSVGNDTPDHTHSPGNGQAYFMTNNGAVNQPTSGAGGYVAGVEGLAAITGGANARHTHPAGSLAVDIPSFNATVDIAQFNSGNLGSGVAHPIVQPYIVFLKIVKVAQ